MSSIRNNKVCWNCEGSVHPQAVHCPYCGVSLITGNGHGDPVSRSQAVPLARAAPSDIPAPPYSLPHPGHESPKRSFDRGDWQQAVEEEESPSGFLASFLSGSLVPMILLLPGVVFLLFGLFLALFSDHGILALEWDAKYWFVYVLLSCPLLYFGWRFLKSIGDSEED